MSEANEYPGRCHCGALRVEFSPSCDPADVPLRMCGCSFCRKHGAVTATAPDGQLLIEIAEPEEAVRYRFETGSADYLVCGRCGVYVAAVVSAFSGAVATLNVNVLEDRSLFSQAPEVVLRDGETAHQRRLRRAEQWTVTTIIVPGADA